MGQMWQDLLGRLGLCTDEGAGMGLLSTNATNAMGTHTDGAASFAAPGSVMVDIDIACADTRMEVFVQLPAQSEPSPTCLNGSPNHACRQRFAAPSMIGSDDRQASVTPHKIPANRRTTTTTTATPMI